MSIFSRNKNRPDPDVLLRKANSSIDKTRNQQPKVNLITSWLQERDGKNGFGEDFDYSLILRRP